MEKFTNFKNLQFVEDIPSRLLCIICRSILSNPHSVPCGHNYCLNCIVSHLENSENKRCVGNDHDCKNEELIMTSNVFPSYSVIREIKNIKVICVLELCNEKVELINLEEHVNNCRFKLIECPFTIVGCTKNKLNKEDMKQHLSDVVIEHSTIMVENVRELKNNNNAMILEIENLKKHLIDLQNKLELNIDNLRSSSFECQNKMELNIDNLRSSSLEHQNKMELDIEYLRTALTHHPNNIKQFQNEISNLKETVDEKQNRFAELEVEIQRNKVKITEIIEIERKMNEQFKLNENFSLTKEVSNLKESVGKKQNCIKALKVEIQKNRVKMAKEVKDVERKLKKEINVIKVLTHNIKKTTNKFEDEMKTVKSFVPNSVKVNSYDWIVDNYTSKFKAALNNRGTYFESAPFYLRGYHLQLQLFPRDPRWLGGRVGIKFKLLLGEYDDLVSWPCPFNLQFAIIDSQNTNFTARVDIWPHSDYTTSNKGESVWERPGDEPQFSRVYYLCFDDDPLEESNKLLTNDSVKIRTKMII